MGGGSLDLIKAIIPHSFCHSMMELFPKRNSPKGLKITELPFSLADLRGSFLDS